MKRVSDTIKEVQYRRLLKRSFEPRKEFLKSSRDAFLAEVAKRRVAPYAPQFPWRTFGVRAVRYGAAVASIVFVATSGLVAYADNRNVSVDSALYPLKRVGEEVRLTITPAIQKPELRKQLAQRRAKELSEIETNNRLDNNGDVKELRNIKEKETKLRSEFRKNIEAIEESGQHAALPVAVAGMGLCQAAEAVEKHASNGKSERYKKFEERCKELLKTEDDSATTETSTPSTMHDDRGRKSEAEKDDSRNQNGRKSVDRSGKRVEQE